MGSAEPLTLPPEARFKVVDLGLGMAAALASKFFVDIGCEVTRVEPAAGDPFYARYPAYGAWHRGKELRRLAEPGPRELSGLLGEADVCIVGGEEFPGVDRQQDGTLLAREHPRLVVLEIHPYPQELAHGNRHGADILVQAASGLCHEHFSDRPMLMSFEPSQYGAALQGLCGTLAALYERERTGRGQRVTTSLYEGALTFGAAFWSLASKPTPEFGFCIPKDPTPLIFRCKDGRYVHIVLGTAGSKAHLYRILGIEDPSVDAHDSGVPRLAPGSSKPRDFFGDFDLLSSYIRHRESGELLAALWAANMAAEPVLRPGECWDDPQIAANGIVRRAADGTRQVGNPILAAFTPAPARASQDGSVPPLAGLRVVDFGTFVAGPYSSVILADLGADVVKVEPLSGDSNRNVYRSFTTANRGKRSLALDMKTEEGRRIAQQLCARADVVINNFRTGVTARLGIDAASLQRVRPDLIVLESPAYGVAGPKAGRAGFDLAFQALCGHEHRAGGVGNSPLWNRTTMIDFAAALLGACAVLTALRVRALTGRGATLHVPLVNAGVYLLSELIQQPDGALAGAPTLNRSRTGSKPAEQLYQTSDGWIAVCVRGEQAARRLAASLRCEELSAPPQSWSERDSGAIAAALIGLTTSAARDLLADAGVWAEACRLDGPLAALGDPCLIARGTVHVSCHPQFGEVREIGPLFQLESPACAARGHTPLLGEQTQETLLELGYDPAQITRLQAQHVIPAAQGSTGGNVLCQHQKRSSSSARD